jgi:hypothetical protein
MTNPCFVLRGEKVPPQLRQTHCQQDYRSLGFNRWRSLYQFNRDRDDPN